MINRRRHQYSVAATISAGRANSLSVSPLRSCRANSRRISRLRFVFTIATLSAIDSLPLSPREIGCKRPDAYNQLELRDATTMAKELARTVFTGLRVGLLHGQMKSDEKDGIMRRFRDGDLQILVSTTVVDVADATVMVVEHAERFGRGCRLPLCGLADDNLIQSNVRVAVVKYSELKSRVGWTPESEAKVFVLECRVE